MKKYLNNFEKRLFLPLTIALVCFILTACSKDDGMNKAVEFFEAEQYEEAIPMFEKMIAEGNTTVTVYMGYGMSLMKLQRYDEAENVLLKIKLSEADHPDLYDNPEECKLDIRKAFLEIYSSRSSIEEMAKIYEEMSEICSEPGKALEYKLEALSLRKELHYKEERYDLVAEDLEAIIELKEYAGNEYLELYCNYRDRGMRAEQLELADRLVIYARAHSAYVEKYAPLISVMLGAAGIASEDTASSKGSEYYFNLADEYIAKAEEIGEAEGDVLRYKAVIAESRGKHDIAYRLLGVYLNHYPDDEGAIKERNYLKNRLHAGDDNR